jgi:hypothetical protein
MIKNILFIPSSGSTLLNNLLAYWKLDETSGTRFDSTANNNDLSDNNIVGFATGKIGSAADFDGTNFLSISSLAGITSDLSISLWTYIRTFPSANPGLIADRPNWGGFWISSANQVLWGRITQSSGTNRDFNDTATSAVLPLNTWVHIVLVVDSSSLTATLYRDTNAINSVSYDGTLRSGVASTFKVGRQATESIDGKIDEVAVWSRALTASEITQLYNSGSGLTYPFV